MTIAELKKLKLPDTSGVYRFLDSAGKILYIGKATSLRDRVRSYFANDLMHTRGKHIVDMVTLARGIRFTKTDSVLEAVILEASLIKRHQPHFNTKEKDDKSWSYVVITKEAFPRILMLRERTMWTGGRDVDGQYAYRFGPFTSGSNVEQVLQIVRKIFPFRDTCVPESGKPCFNRQIGLCPGVCSGEISKEEYKKRIAEIVLFFEGKKTRLLSLLKKDMNTHAKKLEFEMAGECKRMIFALRHINDSALIKEEVREHSRKTSAKRSRAFRIEAYDISHISGKYTVGVMTVVEDGRPKKSDYRKFKIRPEVEPALKTGKFTTGQASNIVNDPLHLEHVLRRRFAHKEWSKPDLIVMDGGSAQKSRAQRVMKELGLDITVVSVVKDARHKPKAILGDREMAESYKHGIIIANAESHRFAVAYHRVLRDKIDMK